jgi:hypothetical protein
VLRDVVCDVCSACRDLDLARDPHLQVCVRPLACTLGWLLRPAIACCLSCAHDTLWQVVMPMHCTMETPAAAAWAQGCLVDMPCLTALLARPRWTLRICAYSSAASPSRRPIVMELPIVPAGAALGVQHVRHGAGCGGGRGTADQRGGGADPRLPAAGPEVPQVPPGGLR